MRIKNWVARVSAANIDFKYKGKRMFRLVLIGVITTWNYYFFHSMPPIDISKA